MRLMPSRVLGFRGVPRSQEVAAPEKPTVGLYLRPYGGPKGGAVSYERGTPVGVRASYLGSRVQVFGNRVRVEVLGLGV